TLYILLNRQQCRPRLRYVLLRNFSGIEGFHPLRKLIKIIRTGDKIPRAAVKPKRLPRMTRGKDGAPVFSGNPDNFRAEVGMQPQFVTYSGTGHITRRLIVFFTRFRADARISGNFYDVDSFAGFTHIPTI